MGVGFDDHAAVQRLINDSSYFPVLVYPGATARNLSKGDLVASDLGERRLLVLLLDATWIGCPKNASSQSKPAASAASDVQRWNSEPLCDQATASSRLPLHARSNARVAGCTGAFRTGSVPRPGSVARRCLSACRIFKSVAPPIRPAAGIDTSPTASPRTA